MKAGMVMDMFNVSWKDLTQFSARQFLTWLVLSMIGLIVACGNAENNEKKNMVEELILYSPEGEKKPLYKLSIPSNYIISDAEKGKALIKAAYPGMVGFSPEIKHRFHNEDGTWGPDLVRVFFSVQPDYDGDDRKNKNRNDTRRFYLESLLRRPEIKLIKTPENIFQKEKIKTYARHQDKQKTYVITQESGRVSIITCPYENLCKGRTDWNGKFSISYSLSINHLENVVDLDKSLTELFNMFNPTSLMD